jgi:pimeloyl-ACP methyl ester carboxylesterase
MAACATPVLETNVTCAPQSTFPFIKRSPSSGNLVIFVHGLFGDAVESWCNGRTGAYWPELLGADSDLSDFDIYVASFESPYVSQSSLITEIAERELQFLDQVHHAFERYQQIYFIGHSMGGLITRRILTQLNRPTSEDKLRRVRAAFFFATPSQGSTLAELGQWISLNPQLRGLTPSDLNDFLVALEQDWQRLMDDRHPSRYPQAYCAYETLATGGFRVVNRVYAATRCDANPVAFDRNHMQIVKPVDQRDQVYTWTRALITNLKTDTAVSSTAKLTESLETRVLRAPGAASGYPRSDPRPWLTLGEMRRPLLVSPGSNAELLVDIKNTGGSPAQQVRVLALTIYQPTSSIPDQIPKPRDSMEGPVSSSVVGPGQSQSVSFGLSRPLSAGQVDAIKKRAAVLYFVGRIDYADLSGRAGELMFCLVYDPADGERVTRLTVCPKHNLVR